MQHQVWLQDTAASSTANEHTSRPIDRRLTSRASSLHTWTAAIYEEAYFAR